jgi:hypothetical protein
LTHYFRTLVPVNHSVSQESDNSRKEHNGNASIPVIIFKGKSKDIDLLNFAHIFMPSQPVGISNEKYRFQLNRQNFGYYPGAYTR